VPKGLTLNDANIEKIRTLRDALAKLQPVRSGAFGIITIPIAATKTARYIAMKYGIPITDNGICFLLQTQDDLNTAIGQMQAFAAEAGTLAEVLDIEE
jgi:hypothetical protein